MGSVAALDLICSFPCNSACFRGSGSICGGLNNNEEKKMVKYLVILMALAFVGCHKKALDQCQVDLAAQVQVNDVLASKVKKCPECVECLPCMPKDCVVEVPQMSSDDVCDYYKNLYSKALHQYRQELLECRNGKKD